MLMVEMRAYGDWLGSRGLEEIYPGETSMRSVVEGGFFTGDYFSQLECISEGHDGGEGVDAAAQEKLASCDPVLEYVLGDAFVDRWIRGL